MNNFELLKPWLLLVIAAIFAINAHEWKGIAAKWEKAAHRSMDALAGWERQSTNSLHTAEEAIRVGQMVQSNYAAHMKTHEPVKSKTPLTVSTNWGDSSSWSYVSTNDLSIWKAPSVEDYLPFLFVNEGETIFEVTEQWDLIVYGQLIGRIVNCKFIPFEP
jgi:hypothetical protein